jgi:hypothetical protein
MDQVLSPVSIAHLAPGYSPDETKTAAAAKKPDIF